MLLARLLGWFKNHQTFSIFLLEIAAVFVGITASLFVDDWRQQRVDREILDSVIEEIHFNAVTNNAHLNLLFLWNMQALDSAITLAFTDRNDLSDGEILDHLMRATRDVGQEHSSAGFDRLANTPLSIPFGDTMARIGDGYTMYSSARRYVALTNDEVRNLSNGIIAVTGLVRLSPSSRLPRTPVDPAYLQSILELFHPDDTYIAEDDNITLARSALESNELREPLRSLIDRRNAMNTAYIELMSANTEVIRTVHEYLPDVALPIKQVGLIGDALPGGWFGTDSFMVRDAGNPDLWRVELSLTDGEVKFRADQNWTLDWGGPHDLTDLSPRFVFEFVGDPTSAFPRGIAQIHGMGIPVQAGRYRISFNSRSFEYSFERVNH